MKINQKNLLIKILFFLNPFISLPILFLEIRNNKKHTYFLLAIFMGLFSFLMAPTGDRYRHFMQYNLFKQMGFQEFIVFLKSNIDYIIYIISYGFSKLNIKFQFIPLMVVFISYFTSFKIYQSINHNSPTLKNKDKFILFLILFFSINFRSITLGIRFGTAAHIFIYGFYLIRFQKENKGHLYIILSALIHFSIWPFILGTYIFSKISYKKIRIIFILSIFMLIFGGDMIKIFMNNFSSFLPFASKIESYIYGYWSGSYLLDKSIKGKIFEFLMNTPYYFLLFYLVFNKKNIKDKKYIYIYFIITNMLFSFKVIFGRYSYIAQIIGIFIFIKTYKFEGIKYRKILAVFLLCICFIVFMSNIYSMRRNIAAGYQKKVIYKPIPFLIMDTYDGQWITNNLNMDGSLRE